MCPKSYLYIYDFSAYLHVSFQSVGTNRDRFLDRPVLCVIHPEGNVSQQPLLQHVSISARIAKWALLLVKFDFELKLESTMCAELADLLTFRENFHEEDLACYEMHFPNPIWRTHSPYFLMDHFVKPQM